MMRKQANRREEEKGTQVTQYNSRALFIAVFQICLLIAFNSAVFANSSSYYDKDGATVYPLETNSIVMKKEVVKIKPSRDGWSATCLFTFYNKSDSSEPVTMGYPDWLKADFKPDSPESYRPFWGFFRTLPAEVRTKYEEDGFGAGYAYSGIYSDGYKQGKIPYIGDAWNLHDLAVSIDGKKVKTKHKAVVDAKSLPGDGAFIWKLTFAPHETKQVKVSFSFSGFHEAEGYQKAIYILQTGALWADKIGMEDIYWDIKGQNVNVKQIVPQDYKMEGNIIHWHFKDFKPTEDIVIYEGDYFENDPKYVTDTVTAIFRTKRNYAGNTRYYNDYDVNDKNLDKNLHPLYLKALRNEIYARNGRTFKSEELNSLFRSCGWYAPKEDYSDEFLNEFEKKNLKFISDYEKKKGWRFQPPAKKPSGRQRIESPGGNVFLGATI